MGLSIRLATAEDAGLIREMIVKLASYQKHEAEVTTDQETLRKQLCQSKPPFECLIAEVDGEAVGFALFYYFYSTWEGRTGLFLEDLYVSACRRSQGLGRALLQRLSELARERGCSRMDWMVQADNHAAQAFYANLGARSLPEWTRWRFDLNQPVR